MRPIDTSTVLTFTAAILIGIGFAGCDVRRKDRIADEAASRLEQALKDTTTVQLIDSVYDFGTRSEGEKVAFSFRFRNSGKKPLIITGTHAGCGCTQPEKPEQPVPPGETGEIKVVFDSKGKSGRQEKFITVESNAQPHFPDLKLTGEITTKK
jgi:hypothetical protein